jgi:predicted nucleic acid-binding protein
VSGPQAALVDTDAFSLLFVRRGSSDQRIAGWRDLLTGRQVLISFQTRAELLSGAIADGWGERRVSKLRAILDLTPTIGVDDEVIDAHAALFAECRRVGHALHAKVHTGDRWIAACAIAKALPLVAGDGIFVSAPNLYLMN